MSEIDEWLTQFVIDNFLKMEGKQWIHLILLQICTLSEMVWMVTISGID